MANTFAPFPNFASKVTKTAAKSGNASDPTVWGSALASNDFFYVPAGLTVTWDLVSSPNLAGGYVKGILDCGTAPGNKTMNLVTLMIDSGGSFKCGSCMTNTPLAGTFTLTFLDVATDPTFDPGQFGTGFLTMGAMVDMCGSANKTAWVWAQGITKGSTTLILQSTPNEWNVGDVIVLSSTTLPTAYDNNAQRWILGANQDEIFTIAGINGNTITLSGTTQYDHLPMPGPTGQVNYLPVPNLTRNIVFQSANPIGTRGHCMFMKDMMGMPSVINACHFLVKDCGRTDAMSVVTDPMVDANGILVPGTAANPRARYAWHSHRQGQYGPDGTEHSCLQTWDSCVVWGFKKWGYDNHDSNVNATNLIAYDGQGAGLATERGTEIGVYDGCLSLRANGSPDQLESRAYADDYGFRGNGGWAQGPGVKWTNNVFGNHTDSGFFVFTTGDPQAGVIAQSFPSANLAGTNIPVPSSDYPMFEVPYFGITNNTSFCCSTGHTTWEHEPFNIGLSSTISNLSSWGCPIGILNQFTSGVNIPNITVAGPNYLAGSVGCNSNNGYSRTLAFTDPQVVGFETGLLLPTLGADSSISGGTFGNVWDFQVWAQTQPTLVNQNSLRNITGTQTYLSVDAAALGSRTRLNFSINPFMPHVLTDNTLPAMFYDIRLTLGDGNQVYFAEQAASYVPVPSSGTYPADFPPELVGQTNQQLWDAYGLAIAGCVASAPITTDGSTNGYVGAGQPLVQSYNLVSPENPTAAQAANYLLSYIPTNQNTVTAIVTETTASPLRPGWNLLTRTIKGAKRTFFVYGPATSPPSPPVTTSITGSAVTLYNEQLTFTVTASTGTVVNEGNVTYTVTQGGTTITTGNVNVANGNAVAIVALSVGSYSYTFSYGDGTGTLPSSNGSGNFSIS